MNVQPNRPRLTQHCDTCENRSSNQRTCNACQARARVRRLGLAGTWLAPLETRLLALAAINAYNMLQRLQTGSPYRRMLARLRRCRKPVDLLGVAGFANSALRVDLHEIGLLKLPRPPARCAGRGLAPVAPVRPAAAPCPRCHRKLRNRKLRGQLCWPCRADDAIASVSGTCAWLEPLRRLLRSEAREQKHRRGALGGQYGVLLKQLSHEPRPVTVAWFYDKPGKRAAALRTDLVRSGLLVLTEGDRGLPRAMQVVERVFAGRAHQLDPADLATLRSYFQWGVFRRVRLRQRTAYGANHYHSAARSRAQLLCEFCAWIHTQGKKLGTIGPRDWEVWRRDIRQKPASHVEVMLRWLHKQHRCPFAPPPERAGAKFERQETAQRRSELRALLTDETIPLRMRVAALFVRVGFKHVEVAALPRADIVLGERVSVQRGGRFLPLRTDFGELVRRLLIEGDPGTAQYAADAESKWLFPGRYVGTHVSPISLWAQMRRRGFGNRPARNSFLLDTAQDFVGINAFAWTMQRNPGFAAQWRKVANARYVNYVRYRYVMQGRAAQAD